MIFLRYIETNNNFFSLSEKFLVAQIINIA